MSPIPGFEEDIFISYAHIDNQPLAEGLKGWVETLHERLEIRLEQLLGEPVKIWRDRKLQGNDIFAETLCTRIANVALLTSIISPRYVRSEWCLRELNEFCQCALTRGGLKIGDKSRIFKIVKTYIPLDEHPPQLHGSLGYEFFEYDQSRERAREFSPEVVPTRDIRYWEKLDDLAYDIKNLLETMRRTAVPGVKITGPETSASTVNGEKGKTIYLAETTSDLSEERDKIKRELQQRGHLVLPDKGLPLIGPALKEAISDNLQRSELSIHLIGSYYGIIPEEESKSLIEIQSELAEQLGDKYQRIIWMPVGLQARNELQQRFIDHFRLGLNGQKGTEVLQTRLEDLKRVIAEKMSSSPQPETNGHASSNGKGNGRPASVYLICDKQDMAETAPLEDYLFNKGLDVILPATEGDESQIIEDHKNNLLDCDAVMMFYGRANEIWLRMKQRELQKIAGYGRTQPLMAKAIYITGPRTEAKERLRGHDAMIIKSYESISVDDLQPFVEKVQKAKGASK